MTAPAAEKGKAKTKNKEKRYDMSMILVVPEIPQEHYRTAALALTQAAKRAGRMDDLPDVLEALGYQHRKAEI